MWFFKMRSLKIRYLVIAALVAVAAALGFARTAVAVPELVEFGSHGTSLSSISSRPVKGDLSLRQEAEGSLSVRYLSDGSTAEVTGTLAANAG